MNSSYFLSKNWQAFCAESLFFVQARLSVQSQIEALPFGNERVSGWVELLAKQIDGIADRFVVTLLLNNDVSC